MTKTITYPPHDTEEYRWWSEGAHAEARARKEGRSKAGLEVRECVDALAQTRHKLDQRDIALWLFRVYAGGLSRRGRLKLVWKALRR